MRSAKSSCWLIHSAVIGCGLILSTMMGSRVEEWRVRIIHRPVYSHFGLFSWNVLCFPAVGSMRVELVLSECSLFSVEGSLSFGVSVSLKALQKTLVRMLLSVTPTR